MLKAYSAGNLLDAYMVQNLLIEAGIDTRILNEFAQGGTGEIPFTQTYPEVWLVSEKDLSAAKEIIAAFEHRPDNPGCIDCQNCAEKNPETFEICWRCGSPLINPNPD